MGKFLIKDSLKGEDTKGEELFIEALLNNIDVSPREIYLENMDVFDNKSAYQEVMEWFRDMFKQGYLIGIKGIVGRYSLKPVWIEHFKSIIRETKEINKTRRKALEIEANKLKEKK